MNNQPKFDFDRNERRALLDRFSSAYTPPKGSQTSRASCVRVLRCIESHLGRNDRGALHDEWRLTWEQLAAETGMSERSVRYAVAQLERDHLIYITEYRGTGWRSHSYRVIWGNVEAAGIVEEQKQEPEKPKTIVRGDRVRGVSSGSKSPLPLASAPLPLDPKPLPLGMATVATRSGNGCHSYIQNKEPNKKPPPPPTPSNPESVSPPTAWREVEEVLRTLGIGQAREATRNARERGASPDDIRAAIDEWRRSPGFWAIGGLAYRIANGVWPKPNPIAEAKHRQANELRLRLLEKGGAQGYSIDHCRFVVAMELRRLGLAEFITPQEAEAVERKTKKEVCV
jgi:hypothetical protein